MQLDNDDDINAYYVCSWIGNNVKYKLVKTN